MLPILWNVQLKRKINQVGKHLQREMQMYWRSFAAEIQFQTFKSTEINEKEHMLHEKKKLLMSL